MNIVKRPLYCDGHRFVVQEGNLVDKTGRTSLKTCLPALAVSVCWACWGRYSEGLIHSSSALSLVAMVLIDWLLLQNYPAYQHTPPIQSASVLHSDWLSSTVSLEERAIFRTNITKTNFNDLAIMNLKYTWVTANSYLDTKRSKNHRELW